MQTAIAEKKPSPQRDSSARTPPRISSQEPTRNSPRNQILTNGATGGHSPNIDDPSIYFDASENKQRLSAEKSPSPGANSQKESSKREIIKNGLGLDDQKIHDSLTIRQRSAAIKNQRDLSEDKVCHFCYSL